MSKRVSAASITAYAHKNNSQGKYTATQSRGYHVRILLGTLDPEVSQLYHIFVM